MSSALQHRSLLPFTFPTLPASIALMVASLAFGGCGPDSTSNPGGGAGVTVYSPPERSFASDLGITSGPITAEQAKQIAVAAVGGRVAVSLEREDQDGMDVFGVLVQGDADSKDVKVRVSDGAVTQIDDGGPDGDEGSSDEN